MILYLITASEVICIFFLNYIAKNFGIPNLVCIIYNNKLHTWRYYFSHMSPMVASCRGCETETCDFLISIPTIPHSFSTVYSKIYNKILSLECFLLIWLCCKNPLFSACMQPCRQFFFRPNPTGERTPSSNIL